MNVALNLDTSARWRLSPPQYGFLSDQTDYTLFVGGVGSGKTYCGARKASLKAEQPAPSLGLIGANTHEQLHQVTLPEFWQALTELGMILGVDYVYNKIPPKGWHLSNPHIKTGFQNVITFRWGAQVVTRSLTKFAAIQGLNLDWAWVDEVKDAKKAAFDTIRDRLRGKKLDSRQLFLTTTPNGFDWLYEFFESDVTERPALKAHRAYRACTTLDNWANLPTDYLQALVAGYSREMARQQIMGQWVDVFKGRCYHAFDRDLNVSEVATYNPRLPVILTCDFNVDPMSWLICQKFRGVSSAIGQKPLGPQSIKLQPETLCVVDEIVIRGSNTPEAIAEFYARGYGDKKKEVEVFGDSYGNHSTAGASDYAVIGQTGIEHFFVPKANPPVIDRIGATNAKMKNAAGEVGVLINPKCKHLIQDLVQVGFKVGTRQIDKSDLARTHTSDAFGYLIQRLWPIQRRVTSTGHAGY